MPQWLRRRAAPKDRAERGRSAASCLDPLRNGSSVSGPTPPGTMARAGGIANACAAGRLWGSAVLQSRAQILQRRLHLRKAEFKPGRQQAARNHAAAFQNQFGLGSEEESAEFKHPFRGWQANSVATNPAKCGHEIVVRDGIGSRDI